MSESKDNIKITFEVLLTEYNKTMIFWPVTLWIIKIFFCTEGSIFLTNTRVFCRITLPCFPQNLTHYDRSGTRIAQLV